MSDERRTAKAPLAMTSEQWMGALAHAWQLGWDARAKYLGSDGDHFPGHNPYRIGQSEEQGPPNAEKDALALLAAHQPFTTYEGMLGAVIRCHICGETTGRDNLEALRRHDIAALVTHWSLNETRR